MLTNMLNSRRINLIKTALTTGILLFSFNNKAFSQNIFVNQLGYYPDLEKYALIENPLNATDASIINTLTNKTILNVNLSPPEIDKFSKQPISKIDFSQLKQIGNYKIKVKNRTSFPFKIDNNIYNKVLTDTTKTFYLQRCGTSINDTKSGVVHPPCHTNDGYIQSGDPYNLKNDKIDTTGGWHDAGDYGKYIASTTIAATLLMTAYENNPSIRKVKIYSNKNNETPEILDEIKYALEWMQKMQREDGAVYRKCSGEQWPSDTTLPQDDKQKRFIYPPSSQETGKFSATMSRAARIYKDIDPVFSKKCLDAAIKSWLYITENPYVTNYESSDDSGSGGYPNPQYDTEKFAYTDIDEKVWAATELYITTEENNYLEFAKNNIDKCMYEPFSWKNTMFMALANLATGDAIEINTKQEAKNEITNISDKLISQMNYNPYNLPITNFKWASNAAILSEGITLTYAYSLSKDEKYKEYAIKTLNYIFGANPLNKSFVTKAGSNPPVNVHHRYSMATGKIIPGLMVGGPNNTANDNTATPGLNIKSYVDNKKSYATNEYAIDYNAPLVYMLSWITSIEK